MIPHSSPWINEEDQIAVNNVIRSGMIARGVLVEKFENQISSYLGVSGSVATSSGTSALVLALQSLDVRKGSEIILPTYVCRSVLEAVLTVGAVPIICDVGPGWVMTSENIEPHLSSKTFAIIAVHTFGIPVDISCFVEFGLPVIEDACQAFGLHIDNKPAGSLGTIGVFSFHATKCLTTGEGGMLASNDRELLVKAKGIRDGNKVPSPRVPSPLSDLQAALGISQLKRYPEFLMRRHQIQEQYLNALNRHSTLLHTIQSSDFLFRFPIRISKEFSELQNYFKRRGIHIRRGVDELLHRLFGQGDEKFPNSRALFRETISVPFYPALTLDECEQVCKALREIET